MTPDSPAARDSNVGASGFEAKRSGAKATNSWPTPGGPPSLSPNEDDSCEKFDPVSPPARRSTISASP